MKDIAREIKRTTWEIGIGAAFLACVVFAFIWDAFGKAAHDVAGIAILVTLVCVTLLCVIRERMKKLCAADPSADVGNHEEIDDTAIRDETHSALHERNIVAAVLMAAVVLLVIFFSLAVYASYNKGVIDVYTFPAAHIEWLVALAAGFGVVGAAWAIWAKLMADKAFEKAAEAATQSLKAYKESSKAYHAISTKSFDFSRFIGGGLLADHIDKAEKSLRLLLSIPAVGFFQKKDGKYPLTDDALTISFKIRRKAEAIEKRPEGVVNVICFERKLCEEIAQRSGMPPELVGKFNADVEHFWADMGSNRGFVTYRLSTLGKDEEERKSVGAHENGDIKFDFDPGLRIAIIDYNGNPGVQSEIAYVWFVSEFVDDAPSEFQAEVLRTEDPQILQLLNSLIDYYSKKLRPVPPGFGAVAEAAPESQAGQAPTQNGN